MKKFLLCAISAVAMLFCASCSNEDIEIGTEVSVTVKPESVIDGLSSVVLNSINDLGELNLRVRLLVYNAEGKLVFIEDKITDSYSKAIPFAPKLSEGNYTMISLVDVVELSNNKINFVFWYLRDSTELGRVQVLDAGYIGNSSKILGASNQKITVGKSGGTFIVYPERQGAIIVNQYYDLSGRYKAVHEPEIENFRTTAHKSCDYMLPNNKNAFEYSFSTDQWYYLSSSSVVNRKETFEGISNTYGYGCVYSFLFPNKNTKISLAAKPKTSSSYTRWNDNYYLTVDMEKGGQYNFLVYYYGNKNGDNVMRADFYFQDLVAKSVKASSQISDDNMAVLPEPSMSDSYMLFNEDTQALKLADI